MSPSVAGGGRVWIRWLFPPLLSVAFAAIWLWPITFGGLRPSGGEITAVSLPAMKAYGRALHQGRLPLWNNQSGIGSPMLAEAQVGVFYPPHLVLYASLEPHDAYAASMLLHFAWAFWCAYVCGRAFDLTRVSASLAALVFAAQGFTVGHLSQSWSYTTGSWLPLVLAAAWRWLRHGEVRWLGALVISLAMQGLAGHFQLAFYTLVCVFVVGTWGTYAAGSAAVRERLSGPTMIRGANGNQRVRSILMFCGSGPVRRWLLLPLAMIAAGAMAAVQLFPSWELATGSPPDWRANGDARSSSRPPWHFVSELAPPLLRNPLWEPAVWSPWESSYDECLSYVGLLPLGLAAWALLRSRGEETVRVCGGLLLISVLLSWGQHVPGLSVLLELPGLGWFVAPARWSIVTGLCLALLAGRGLEWMEPTPFAGWCRSYVAIALVSMAIGVALVCRMLLSLNSFELSYTRSLGLLTHGYEAADLGAITPAGQMWQVLRGELTLPALNLVLLLLVSLVPDLVNNPRRLVSLVLVWTFVDLFANAELSGGTQFEPSSSFAARSPVLQHLGEQDSHRVAGSLGNRAALVNVAGLGPGWMPHGSSAEKAGRTRDLQPAAAESRLLRANHAEPTARWGARPWTLSADDIEWLRLTDTRLLVVGLGGFDPLERERLLRQMTPTKLLLDPWLAADVFGRGVLKLDPQAASWAVWQLGAGQTAARAWLFPLAEDGTGPDPRTHSQPPAGRLRMLESATPLEAIVDEGERVRIRGRASSASVLVLGDSHDPGWQATVSQAGTTRAVAVEPAFGELRSVPIPQAGDFEVVFEFRPRSFRVGAWTSIGAGFLTILASVWGMRRRLRWIGCFFGHR